MDTYIAIVGSYARGDADGIHSYSVDAEDGELVSLDSASGGDRPAFLSVHPEGEYLYAVNEVKDGAVVAMSIDHETGDLIRLNRTSSGGAGPCYCSVDATGEYVLVSNYLGGSVSMLPIGNDGRVGDPVDVIEYDGSGPTDRQDRPYPHSVVPGPEGRFAYASLLGLDRVYGYEINRETNTLWPIDPPFAALQPGSGPRHFDVHPNGRLAYLINETDSTLTAFDRDPTTGTLTRIATTSILPKSYDGDNGPADIHVHPSGEWVYGSNRGHDSIAVYGIDPASGSPALLEHESVRGSGPRGFALDPAGDHLFAGNRGSDEIVVFEVGDDGTLDPTGHVTNVPSPSCLKLLCER